LKKSDFPYTVKVLFSTGEELGCRGAIPGSFSADVIGAIVTDVSFAVTPDSKAEKYGKMSGGTMIGISPALDTELSSKAVFVAKKHNIAHQPEVLGGKTGTDADVISVSKTGIPTVLLSIPLKNMHTPVEMVDLHDICATGECMAALIQEGVFTK
jgi:endoglucanase